MKSVECSAVEDLLSLFSECISHLAEWLKRFFSLSLFLYFHTFQSQTIFICLTTHQAINFRHSKLYMQAGAARIALVFVFLAKTLSSSLSLYLERFALLLKVYGRSERWGTHCATRHFSATRKWEIFGVYKIIYVNCVSIGGARAAGQQRLRIKWDYFARRHNKWSLKFLFITKQTWFLSFSRE